MLGTLGSYLRSSYKLGSQSSPRIEVDSQGSRAESGLGSRTGWPRIRVESQLRISSWSQVLGFESRVRVKFYVLDRRLGSRLEVEF